VRTLLGVAVSVVPVFLFLGILVVLDSYKLVTRRAVLLGMAAGVAAALACYVVNVRLRPALGMEFTQYSRYVAPVLEELCKAAYIVFLLSRSRVGFVVDAAIFGFAVGTGFAVTENLYYLAVNPDASIWVWFVRGFGTAVMHGGCTAILTMITRTLHHRREQFQLSRMLPGLLAAVALHSLYNHLLLKPVVMTGLIVLVFPYLSLAVFQQSERGTRAWLGTGFDTDQELLVAVRSGQLLATPVGQYLMALRRRFPPEAVVDMLCLVRLRVELSIQAKGLLLAREAGFELAPDPSLPGKFTELRYLERSLGTTGVRALRPFLSTSMQDLWQLRLLSESAG
jgi:RsiW-degrading membrane proteinase PrsW (M82 family)